MQPQIDLKPVEKQLLDKQYTWENPITKEKHTINGLEASRSITATQGKNKGRLRASKPPMKQSIIKRVRYNHESSYYDHPLLDCAAAQIWRYVAFEISTLGQHHCLPMMADLDSPFDMSYNESREFAKWCQSAADIILGMFKAENKPGLLRWSRAFYV